MDDTEKLTGMVCAGRGKASLRLEKYKEELEHYFQNSPHPGSFNLVISKPVALNYDSVIIFGSDQRAFWPIIVNNLPCLIYRWHKCPLHVLEIVSDVNLRKYLGVKDGNIVKIQIPKESQVSLDAMQHFLWLTLWRYRESWYYKRNCYTQTIKRIPLLNYLYHQKVCQNIDKY